MKRISAFLLFIFLCGTGFSQWNSLPGTFTGSGGRGETAFSIPSLGRGYVVGGAPGVDQTFYYDTLAKSWTQVSNYPGTPTDGTMVGLSVNDTGYVGTGTGWGNKFDSTMWRYDPVNDTWLKRAHFPGTPRAYAIGFTIGRMCFIGVGIGGTPGGTGFPQNDFYEYDTWKNKWTKVTSTYPGSGSALCVSFVIGDKAYVGGGLIINGSGSITGVAKDFWEYDTTSKVWTQVADFGGGVRSGASGFGYCDKGYVGLGTNDNSQVQYQKDFWQFDPNKGALGTWTRIKDFAGIQRYTASEFMIGKTGFITLGVGTGNTTETDIWEFIPTVTPGFTSNTTVCTGSSITFTDTSNYTPTQWQWTFPGGTPATSTAQNPTVAYANPGNYDVTLQAWNGCDSGSKKFTTYVSVSAGPSITITPANTTICFGSPIALQASGATTYQWVGTTNTTDSIQGTPTKDTTYILSVSNGKCSKDTNINVTVTPLPVPTISTAQAVCLGSSVPLLAGGGSTYTWTPATGLSSTGIDNPVATPANTTTYTVTVANGACTATDNVVVTVNPLPTGSAIGATTINIGESTTLGVTNATAGATYIWSPASSLSCSICADPVATPTTTTWYKVTIKDNAGCSIDDSVMVDVIQHCGSIYMPNAFSPNGDGTNDVLSVKGNCIKGLDLIIFDRWGNKVFETTNPSAGWDGTFKGKPLNSGTYVYSVEISDLDNNTISKKGNVTLLR